MNIIKSFEIACNLALDCNNKIPEKIIIDTLSYIMNYLQHNCYMLCVYENNIQKMYKLVTYKTSNYVENFLKYKKIPNNIRKKLTGPVRLMGCIFKQYKESFDTTYQTFLKDIPLPRGVYILNLSDSVIVSHDNDPFKLLQPKFRIKDNIKHFPIMSLSGRQGYHDILIPPYDDLEYITNKEKQEMIMNCNHNWESKTSRSIFRGGPSGCSISVDGNQRLKVALLKDTNIDAGIFIKDSDFVKSNSIKIDSITKEIGQIYEPKIKTVNFMTLQEQSNYKYIIHIDGNVAAYRLLTTMMTSSLILRVTSEYTLWCDKYLIPYVHYIPVKNVSELPEILKWCMSNDEICKKISENGTHIASTLLTKEFITNEMIQSFNVEYC
jgi:hypothetical protein